MAQSPEKPWIPGIGPEYKMFRLRVNVCQDSNNNVWSDHDFETSADQRTAESLENKSLPQIAHALLTEAIRRELYLCSLVKLTKNKTYVRDYQKAEPEEREAVEQELAEYANKVITKAVSKMTLPLARGILDMLSQGI